MEFSEDLPTSYSTRIQREQRQRVADPIFAVLKENAGRWGLVEKGLPDEASASKVRHRLQRAKKWAAIDPGDDVLVATRRISPGEYGVWASYQTAAMLAFSAADAVGVVPAQDGATGAPRGHDRAPSGVPAAIVAPAAPAAVVPDAISDEDESDLDFDPSGDPDFEPDF